MLLAAWRERRAGRAAPVLLVVLHAKGASLCGATGEEPPVYPHVDAGQVERVCGEVLDQPDRHAALRFLAQALPSLETALPGLSNEGLLALHELEHGAPTREDWADAGRKAGGTLGTRDDALLTALGFRIEKLDNLTSLLRSGDRRTALAVMLRETESPEAGTARFNNLSPVSYALAKADSENLSWVIVVQGNRLRLYSTAVDAGVGRRGRTETFIECQPSLLTDANLAYLWLLYSAEALTPEGSLNELLEDSQRFAGNLADQLRERIYDIVVPVLAQGIATERELVDPGPEDLERTYEMALTVLFRILFIAYAEDRDLLPYRQNDAYRRRSLKQKAQELAKCVADGTPIAGGSTHWQETTVLCKAVDAGNRQWSVPAYNGGLFSDQPDVSMAGAELAEIILPNEAFERALRALLVIETAEGVPGPVDFRSLGVREFGTIYEGLLESELAVASTDLALNKKGVYVPAKKRDEVAVGRGEIYLHNSSGVRKSSGSYYTKHFAVEHLLNGSLEPGLRDHLARIKALDDADAGEELFDFRVADLAMGSGHFLIAAIDRIEKAIADFLTERHLPRVRRELAELREAAKDELGELAEAATIEDGQLLRRLIARRCIYGVDLNVLSVQLARLAVWIHTFVPGLPLSVLDHRLVHGNALVGVGTTDEIQTKLEEKNRPGEGAGERDLPLFGVDAQSLLAEATQPLNRLANINDATLRDIEEAREAMREAGGALAKTAALCDLITAAPITNDKDVASFLLEDWQELPEDLETHSAARTAHEELAGLAPLHFPVTFPEVFLRRRRGFDVIIGNPPWQEATVEEDAFWARHFPGLRSLPQREQEAEKKKLRRTRRDLVTLYESERNAIGARAPSAGQRFLPRHGDGRPRPLQGLLLALLEPDNDRRRLNRSRSAAQCASGQRCRRSSGERFSDESAKVEIEMLLNRAGWVFDEAEHRYTIGLVCITHGAPGKKSVSLRGPFASFTSFAAGRPRPPATFARKEVLAWNDSVSLPLLPTEESVDVFAQLRKAPRLDLSVGGQWRARPDAELHATSQKYLMDLNSRECPKGFWPVYKGESFDLWTPDTGVYYAFADPKPTQGWIQSKRCRAGKSRRDTAHGEFSLKYLRDRRTLPCHAARVAFRDVTNRTNQRTVIACLLPPKLFIGNQAPYLLWPRGEEKDQAYLLGVLSSIPLDWYARRFVETHVNYFVFNPLPVPRPSRDDARWRRVVELAGRLACPDRRFRTWAKAVGVECGRIADDAKEDMIHELDAVVAHLYGLSKAQLVHIFETFHEGWDYQARLDGVLNHFQAWKRH